MTRRADVMRSEKVLKSIDTPVLMAICEKDRLVNNDAIRRAADLLPKGELIEIKDGYHGLWTERQKIRDQWFARIDSFIEGIEKQRKPAAENDNKKANNPAAPAVKQVRPKQNSLKITILQTYGNIVFHKLCFLGKENKKRAKNSFCPLQGGIVMRYYISSYRKDGDTSR